MAIQYFLNYTFGFLCLRSFGSANAHLPGWVFPQLDILLEYWIEPVTFGLLYVMFTFPTRIFYRGIPCFAADYHCGVLCRG